MSDLRLYPIMFFVVVTVIVRQRVTCANSILNLGHSDYEKKARLMYNDDSNIMEDQQFIRNSDIIKLMDLTYALKQLNCVLNKEPCDDVGERIKASLSEQLLRDCRRCTFIEKRNIQHVISYVQENFPEYWIQIYRIYG